MPRTKKTAGQIIELIDRDGEKNLFTPDGLETLTFNVPALITDRDTTQVDTAIIAASQIADLPTRVAVLVELANARDVLAILADPEKSDAKIRKVIDDAKVA